MTEAKRIIVNKRLSKLFNFLEKHREYNLEFQKKVRLAILKPYRKKKDRLFNLLHTTYYSQRSPDLDSAQFFFENLLNYNEPLDSLRKFCLYLGEYDKDKPYKSLYNGLLNQDNWGPKTSALFVKDVYQIHHAFQLRSVRFWKDVPSLEGEDEMYLPVDAVIKDIFTRIDKSLKDFKSINKYLQANKKWRSSLLWDDLWFWGFITQKGSVSPRKLEFNKGKYWLQLHTEKDKTTINRIKKLCNQFITILKRLG